MTITPASKRNGLTALHRVQADTENQTTRKGTSPMTVQIASDTRIVRRTSRRGTWWTIAVVTALVVLVANSPIVTVVAVWLTFAVVVRLEVVDRRRARRAQHRALLRDHAATLEAITVANGSHLALVEVAA